MLERLQVTNLPSGYLGDLPSTGVFLLKTCQRTLIISSNESYNINYLEGSHLRGPEAYTFLLQIICGLKSKLLGESEIVSQFKSAYQEYVQFEDKCTQTLLILEKLFKDAKEIRTKYLIGLGQKTYSSLTRRHIYNKNKAESVLILGSGQLAEDLINQFKKKTKVYISARNIEKVNKLKNDHDIEVIEWKDFATYKNFPFIANSIGCSKSRFIEDEFFQQWKSNHSKRLFVDLGSPSVINTILDIEDGVMRLNHIFEEGAIHEEHKQQQLDKAENALKEIVNKRKTCLNQKSKLNELYARKV